MGSGQFGLFFEFCLSPFPMPDKPGAIHTLDSMNHFFLAGQMFIVGREIGIGRDKGDVEKDEEGLQMVKTLGQRMAWLLKRVT
jgi:multimeric flavodoxin WrbA